jgi:SAM-dependent methyltransferase
MSATGVRRFERAPITSLQPRRPDLLDADWTFRGVPVPTSPHTMSAAISVSRTVSPGRAKVSDFTAFARMERSGWSDPARAEAYVGFFASASEQAIGNLLDAAAAESGLKALDLCCGQGNVSEALIGRGCRVVGADFSSVMLSFARERVPNATFVEADAQHLPFGDREFDVVVSNLGVCHVPDQPCALSEVRRVLRPGGRFAMTVWCGPDVSPSFEIVYGAVRAYGSPHVSAPSGPDFHQFANRENAERLLSEAGFGNVDFTIVDCAWDLDTPERLCEIYEKGTVRAAMLLGKQPASNLVAIRSAIAESVRERFAIGNRWRVPVPAALLVATALGND